MNRKSKGHAACIAIAACVFATLAGTAQAQTAAQDKLKAAGCATCHSSDESTVGPSTKELSTRFAPGDAKALVKRLRTSGFGSPGPALTVIHDVQRFNDDELRNLIGLMLQR